MKDWKNRTRNSPQKSPWEWWLPELVHYGIDFRFARTSSPEQRKQQDTLIPWCLSVCTACSIRLAKVGEFKQTRSFVLANRRSKSRIQMSRPCPSSKKFSSRADCRGARFTRTLLQVVTVLVPGDGFCANKQVTYTSSWSTSKLDRCRMQGTSQWKMAFVHTPGQPKLPPFACIDFFKSECLRIFSQARHLFCQIFRY